MKAFKARDRKNDFMNVIAGQLSDADIHQFAQFWSGLPASPASESAAAVPAGPAIPSRMSMPADFPKHFRVYQTESGDAETDSSGKPLAGAVQSYSSMESRAGWGSGIPVLLRNGDWDYALFGPDGKRRDQLNQAPCLACHKPQETNSFVFTLDELRKAAG